MRIITAFSIPILVSFVLYACNNVPQNQSTNNNETKDNYEQSRLNGKWQMDLITSQELKGMAMTIDNFALLNKKKFENNKAYQEFGLLLENHLKRIEDYCTLNNCCKQDLNTKLEVIKTELPALSTGDKGQGKAALERIKTAWAQVDSSFIYN